MADKGTLRAAEPSDAEAIEAFLRPLAETSMFLRSNLRRHGPCGGEAAAATRMWLTGDPLDGVIGLTSKGYLSVQMPKGVPGDLANAMAGAQVAGMTGPPDQVAAVLHALGLDQDAETAEPRIEPLYRLALRDLVVPEGPGDLRLATVEDISTLAPLRQAYQAEALDLETSLADAKAGLAPWIADGRLALLEVDGAPVTMTGFNATLPDMVQVGGVYTPQELRNRGHARRAVALHLAHARQSGVGTAILFAATTAACRAYEAIGFARIGAFRLAMFETPQTVRR